MELFVKPYLILADSWYAGVEGVSIDMAKNEVSIKGIIVDPEAICAKITKKTKRVAKVLSPLPPAEGEPIPQLVNSQVSTHTPLPRPAKMVLLLMHGFICFVN